MSPYAIPAGLLQAGGFTTQNSGNYAAWSLVLLFLICGASFCLLFAIVIMALLGRFRRKPHPEEDEDFSQILEDEDSSYEPFFAAFRPEPGEEEAEPDVAAFLASEPEPRGNAEAEDAAGTTGPTKAPPKPKTGFLQLLGACLACVPALLFFSLFENSTGPMVTFNFNTLLEAALLLLQILLFCIAMVYQRRR